MSKPPVQAFGCPRHRPIVGCLLVGVALLGVSMVGLCAPGAERVPPAALERRIGHAFSLASGDKVYREIHEPVVEEGRLLRDRVTYETPDGRVIARKEVDYSRRPLAPDFRLEDERTGYVEGLETVAEGRIALFRRESAEAATERVVIDVADKLVADAGFDLVIYRRLAQLKAGETLEFPFAAAGRLDTYDYRLRKLGEARVLGEPAIRIRFEPQSTILRWLADPIDVAYQRETGALLRYEGVSNLPNPNGDGNYRVRIDFPPDGRAPEPPTGDE